MTYLLDTCVLSELQKPAPDPRVAAWFDAEDEAAMFASVLTVGELRKGAVRVGPGTTRIRWLAWIEGSLLPSFGRRLLPVSIEVANAWGEMCGRAAVRGEPLPVLDSLIAATAVANDLVVVTRNVRDFERSGVTVLNPWLPL
jgi:hypothetical protein